MLQCSQGCRLNTVDIFKKKLQDRLNNKDQNTDKTRQISNALSKQNKSKSARFEISRPIERREITIFSE